MRGKLLVYIFYWCKFGITPAYAGKTSTKSISSSTAEDHPRVCGENDPIPDSRDGTLGSPPRMRGKPAKVRHRRHSRRITPAYAGKTRTHLLQVGKPQDHPRVCGENSFSPPALWLSKGSPPRMRGKPKRNIKKRILSGITPAYAGKTKAQYQKEDIVWDHPRVCGENCGLCLSLLILLGSPPRMRGKH